MTKLIGTGTNQVPTNADLGTMAYQDVESVKVEAFESNGIDDNADATAITISSSGTTAFSGYPNPIVSISSIDTTVGSTDRLLDLNFVDSDSSEGYYIKFSDNDGEVGAIRATGASGVRFVTGNGGGIDFSANGHADGMTSELLDDYEEGTWTPTTNGDASGVIVAHGSYVKVGRTVTVQAVIRVDSNFTGTSIGGLPFTSTNAPSAVSGVHGNVQPRSDAAIRYFQFNNDVSYISVKSDHDNTLVAPATTDGIYRFMTTYLTGF